jgi:Peptidase family M48
LTVRALRCPSSAFTFAFMAQVGQLDFRRYLETRKGPAPGPQDEAAEADRGHAYSYVSDRNTRMAFTRMRPVELAVTAAVRLFKAVGKNQLLGNAVRVGPNQFPRMHRLVTQCAETLGITTPTLYITNSPVMNAMTFGTNDDSFIIVHSALVDYFTDDELLSVIGHETGHIHNNHVVYLTALFYLRNMASVFLKGVAYPAELALSGWMRRAEITCDRAGMLCCKDVEVSRLALAKLALGSTKLLDELNVDAFAGQYEDGKSGVGRYAEITASHPWISKRLQALRVFGESELYRQHAGLGAGGLTMDQVDEKVHEVIKVVG